MIRNTHRVGDYLMRDEVSGVIRYRSDMAKEWDGTWRVATDLDGKHPTLFFRPFIHDETPRETVPVATDGPLDLSLPTFVGTTSVLRQKSPADWLFE